MQKSAVIVLLVQKKISVWAAAIITGTVAHLQGCAIIVPLAPKEITASTAASMFFNIKIF